jgi:hypothetical protein
MAVYLKPCHGCPIGRDAECTIRDEMRRRVSGLGLRSASFRCSRLAEEIRVGRRVRVSVVIAKQYHGPDGGSIVRGAVKATVTGSHDGEFCFRIDEGEIKVNAIVREPEKIHYRGWTPVRRIVGFLDEPDVPADQAWQATWGEDGEVLV